MSKLRQSVRFWVSISIYGCVFLGQPLWAAQKSALIIGNSRYLLGDRLTNPQNDAEDIANKLKSLGFDVILLKDANLAQMLDSIDQFKSKLRQGDVALFYFAGHGLQVDGQNYLVPIDAKMNSRSRVAYEAVKLSDVSNALAQGNITNNIIIIDACRNDPFPKELRDGSRGLARLDSSVRSPKKKLFYLFASAPGTVAQDGKGRNGIFTQELLKYLGQAGLTMPDLYEAVSSGVLVATDNKQEVYHEGDMLARFSLVPSPVVAVKPPVQLAQMQVRPIPQANPVSRNEQMMQQGMWRDQTNLVWMRCSLGQTLKGNTCVGTPKRYTWEEALDAAKVFNKDGGFGGYTDWVVPHIEDLYTIRYCSKGFQQTQIIPTKADGIKTIDDICKGRDYQQPTINQNIFPNTRDGWYWSSSQIYDDDHPNGNGTWIVAFDRGGVYDNYEGQPYATAYLRLVRYSQ